jgi:transaldolase
LLTISPSLLEELAKTPGTVTRKLSPENANSLDAPKQSLTESAFRWMLNEDQMATEKLSDGIRSFAADAIKLEKFIARKLAELK